MGGRQARQGGERAQPIMRQSHATSLERARQKKIEPKFWKYVILTLARVVFQTKVVYQAKFFESKQVVYQVGLIPKHV